MVKDTRFRIMAMTVALCLVVMSAPVTAQAAIRLVVNDNPVQTDVPPLLESGRTLVPVRVVSENMGATVTWNGSTGTVGITMPGCEVTLTIGRKVATVNGVDLTLDVPPKIVNGRTLVPLRFVAEALGATVNWDAATRTVTVHSYRITAINWNQAEDRGRLRIEVPSSVNYTISAAEGSGGGSPTLIMDLHGAKLALPQPVIPVGQGNVMQVRTGMVTASVSRIILDLSEPVRYRVTRSPDGRYLDLEIGYKVNRASYERRPEGQAVVVYTTGPVQYEMTVLTHPDRLVIDIQDTTLSRDTNPLFEIKSPLAERVRIAQFQVDPDVVRVVIDLKRSVQHHIKATPRGLEVFLYSELTAVEVSDKPGEITVDIITSMPTGHGITLLEDPLRLCVDIPLVTIAPGLGTMVVNRGLVHKIEVSPVKLEETELDAARVEIYLTGYLGHEIRVSSRGIQAGIIRSAAHGKTVVIDPGHGGTDPGAVSPSGVYEKDLNIAISTYLRDHLVASGARVVMTRDKDTSVDLYSRPQIANLLRADAFISVHCNSFGDRSKAGFELYYWPSSHSLSVELARVVHRHMLGLGLTDRGIKTERFVVIREAAVPAVLVETAFLSNAHEEKLLCDPTFQRRVAKILAEALIEFLGRD